MFKEMETAAKSVGLTLFVSNSSERIENTLNRITGIDNLPVILISWDLNTTVDFDSNGFLMNPSTSVVALLMDKAENNTAESRQATSEKMGSLFILFVKKLNENLRGYSLDGTNSVSGISYLLAPLHGAGKHSGVLGKFTMKSKVINCKEDC